MDGFWELLRAWVFDPVKRLYLCAIQPELRVRFWAAIFLCLLVVVFSALVDHGLVFLFAMGCVYWIPALFCVDMGRPFRACFRFISLVTENALGYMLFKNLGVPLEFIFLLLGALAAAAIITGLVITVGLVLVGLPAAAAVRFYRTYREWSDPPEARRKSHWLFGRLAMVVPLQPDPEWRSPEEIMADMRSSRI